MPHSEKIQEALAREADKGPAILELCTGHTGDGRAYYAYLSIPPSKYRPFLDARNAGQPMRLADYGFILQTGWGAEPPQEVRERMEKEHGFDHMFEKTHSEELAELLALKRKLKENT